MNKNKFDAVIVLANQMDEYGTLNDESIARAELAVNLCNKSAIDVLVTCGWNYREDSEIKIADAFAKFIIKNLNLKARIISEQNSRDTVGDAYFTKVNIAIPLKWKKIYVVTTDYHVERTQKIFDFVYGSEFEVDVIGHTSEHGIERLESEKLSLTAFENTFSNVKSGDDVEIFKSINTKHPYYNGEIYSKI